MMSMNVTGDKVVNVLLASAIASLLICQTAFGQEVASDEPLVRSQLMGRLPVVALRSPLADDATFTAEGSEGDPKINFGQMELAGFAATQSDLRDTDTGKAFVCPETWDCGCSALSDCSIYWKPGPLAMLPKVKDLPGLLKESPGQLGISKIANVAMPPPTSPWAGSKDELHVPASVSSLSAGTPVVLSTQPSVFPGIPIVSHTRSGLTSGDLATVLTMKSALGSVNFGVLGATGATEQIPAIVSAIQLAELKIPTAISRLIDEGDADFGRPLVFTSQDKALTVEKSLLNQYDVYWVELAFSPSEELLQNVTELRYEFTIDSPGSEAFDLVPAQFGIETSRTDVSKTPTVQIKGVEVGEMFSRSVTYKYIRPTILSHGVLTPSFGWIFKGESLDASAKRMYAVVGVAKAARKISVKITLLAKCSHLWGLASEWASTGPFRDTIYLPN